MPVYEYNALSETGAVVSGEQAAPTIEVLKEELSSNGLLVQSVSEKGRIFAGWLGRSRPAPQEFLLFNQEFKTLIRAGLTIPEALELAADRPGGNPVLASTLSCVLKDVREGKQLSEACGLHPNVFDGLYLSSLKTGEKSGNLVTVLERYQHYLQHRISLQKQLSQAALYPMILLAVLLVILVVLFVFVMPRFAQMYTDFGTQLPLPTRILIGVVDHIHIYGPIAALVTIAAYYGLRSWRRSSAGEMQWSRFMEKLPVIGHIVVAASVAKLTRTLSTLLSGGTPLVEALATAQIAMESAVMRQRIEQVRTRVIEGDSLAEAFRQSGALPNSGIKLVEVGEMSGSLEQMLAEVAGFQEELLDSSLTRLSSLMEPLLMLLMGVLVGGIIIVMYLPIFHMADVIR